MSSYGFPPANSGNTTTQYSRVDLQAAFNWLVNQPDHVRKQASDPDRLMTLYYRSSGRAGNHSETTRTETMRADSMRVETSRVDSSRMESEAPISSQNFLSDLRQINEALRQFDSPGAQPMSLGHTNSHTSSHPASHIAQGHANTAQAHAPQASTAASTTQQTVIHTAPQAAHVHIHNSVPAPQVTAHAGAIGLALNGRTQSILMEVREKLNLSSETEALQMLVAIGYKQLKPLID
jgi:hypothetical protein